MHRNQSVSAHSFAMVPRADIPVLVSMFRHRIRLPLMLVSLFPFMLMKFCPVILFR